MARLSDVAEMAGVSVATVSRVINESAPVSTEVRARVKAAIEELDYALNVSARSLRTNKAHAIGFLTTDAGVVTNPFLLEVGRGIEATAARLGYPAVIRSVSDDAEGASSVIRMFRQNQVDGLVIAGILEESSIVSMLQDHGFPFVLVSRKLENLNTNYVGVDDHKGMGIALTYLHDLGHTRIAYISGDERSSVTQARLSGYHKAMQSLGLDFEEDYIIFTDYSTTGAYQAADQLCALPSAPTAILAATDRMAFGAWRALSTRGLTVPDDVSLMGFDDIECSSLGPVGLTTIRRSMGEMGQHAAELLIKVMTEGSDTTQTKVLPVQLVERDTCARPPFDGAT